MVDFTSKIVYVARELLLSHCKNPIIVIMFLLNTYVC